MDNPVFALQFKWIVGRISFTVNTFPYPPMYKNPIVIPLPLTEFLCVNIVLLFPGHFLIREVEE